MANIKKNSIISPIATALWLVDNTSLTFKQIADFCGIYEQEVQSIADGFMAKNMVPLNPIKMGCSTQEEINAREKDGKPVKNTFEVLKGLDIKIAKQRKYIPISQRRNRPEAVFWLLTYAPELEDAQIVKLARTTKAMIQQIRNKEYKGYNDLVPKDPVVLGYCSQKELNDAMEKAKKKADKIENEKAKAKKSKSKAKKSK